MKYKNKVVGVVLYLLLFGIVIFAFMHKENYHVDEIYSYGLANHPSDDKYVSMKVKRGKIYKNTEKPYMDYMAVNEDGRFDYQNVWENQKKDVHPPLYYVILHTICSFFPETFSLWYAASINVLFVLLSFWIYRKLILYLLQNERIVFLYSVAFVLCSGIISSTTFLRMYAMTTFWCLLIAYLFIQLLEKKTTKKILGFIAVTTILSALTHYYCIVYVVLMSVVYGLIILCRKNWKGFIQFFGVMIGSAVVVILVFPGMINHIFFGYRGEESINNLKSGAGYVDRLKAFYSYMDVQLFGKCLTWLGVFVAVALIWHLIKSKKRGGTCNAVTRYVLLLIPIFLFYVLIAKIAVYQTDRYLFPVYGIVMATVLSLVSELLSSVLVKEKIRLVMLTILVMVMTCGSWQAATWPYLYQNTTENLAMAKQLSDVDCIFFYSYRYELHSRYVEIKNYGTVTFLNAKNEIKLPEYEKQPKELVVIISSDRSHEDYLNEIMKSYPTLVTYSEMPNYGTGTGYYLTAK